jgi:hypothetical protein
MFDKSLAYPSANGVEGQIHDNLSFSAWLPWIRPSSCAVEGNSGETRPPRPFGLVAAAT